MKKIRDFLGNREKDALNGVVDPPALVMHVFYFFLFLIASGIFFLMRQHEAIFTMPCNVFMIADISVSHGSCYEVLA